MKRLILILIALWLLCAPLKAQTVVKIWIDPNANSVGYTHKQFVTEVMAGLRLQSQISQVNFKRVYQASQAHVWVKTRELYLGNKSHARGLFDPATPNTIWIHSGHVSANRHSCTRAPCDKAFDYQIINPGTLGRIACHERLHQIWGPQHSFDARCIMHASVGPALCPSEVTRLRTRYGYRNRKPKMQAEGESSWLDASEVVKP